MNLDNQIISYMKKSFLRSLFFCTCIIASNILYAQLQMPFASRYNATLYGDFLTIGNNVLSTSSTGNYTGGLGNHSLATVFVDIDADATTFNSSSANLTSPLPSGCVTIKKVFLYWAAADYPDPGNEPVWNYNQIKLRLPSQATYSTITADNVIYEGRSTNFVNNPYACFKDITNLVNALPSPFGTYQVANVKAKVGTLNTGSGNIGTSGGWQLVVIYEGATDPSGVSILPPKYISIFDGFANVTSNQNNYSINVSGFQTPAAGLVTGKLMFGSLEGDRDLTGDRLQIRNNANVFVDLSTANRSTDNFFNSRITVEGTDFTNRNPASTNTLGYDIGYFTPTTPNIFTNNQTTTDFRLTSNQETYALYMLGLSIDVKGPNFNPLLSTVTPGTANPGTILNNTLVVKNNGDDNARNVFVTRVIPQELDLVEPIISLPAGVTYTYNNASRLLTFFFVDGFTDVNDPALTISYQTVVKPQCYFLETSCVINSTATYTITYNGVINASIQTTSSSSAISSCGIGNNNPNVININTPSAAQWATSTGDLNVTINCNNSLELANAQILVPTTDKCNFTLNKISGVFVPINNACPIKGTYTNTWTFTDKCGRVSPTFSQIITVQDTTKPILSNVPESMTVSCEGEVPAANINSVTATDGCGGTVTVRVSDVISNQRCANRYEITRTWTATDVCGNSSAAAQTIVVNDTIKPIFTGELPQNITVCDLLPNIPNVEASDNCGIDSIYFSEILDTSSGVWQYTRTWEAKDLCGNVTKHIQNIILHKSTILRISKSICSGDSVLINDIFYSKSGFYTDTLETINGCDSILEVTIEVLSLPDVVIKIDGNNILCENQNLIKLLAQSQSDTYQWYKNSQFIEGAEDSILSVSKSGIYSVVITSLTGCKNTDTISIVNADNCPEVDTISFCIPVRNDTIVCFNAWIELPTPINNIEFCESPKEEVEIIFNAQSGCAELFINSVENFKDTLCVVFCDEIGLCDTLIIELCGEKITTPPIAVDDCLEVEKNTETLINVLSNDYDPDGYPIYNMGIIVPPKFGEADLSQQGGIIYTPIKYYCGKDTLYYQVCDNFDGCDTGLVCINIDCECIYPEVITPNNDGINDALLIPCLIGVDNAKLFIWNRWGSIIYEDDNYKNNWQGTYNGEELPVGTYWYSVEYYNPNKEKVIEVRYFMIIK